ncbi:hypothetical protein RND71_021958 [Anisodus tanguticus]|uniref:IP5PC-F beta-propeller domain-containing protein n=1 Tax=Anisodus tanguticus TaxID=243964 RepID=A0AAE1RW58_9SOLA|nr:hypothetical protein RND71_021958 [Anisodus tanguticus]
MAKLGPGRWTNHILMNLLSMKASPSRLIVVIYGQGPRVVTLGFGHGNLLRNLSLSPEERHMAALLVERLFVDLRSQVTVNGVCNISSSDVKCLLSDHVKGKVWAAGSTSFSLWNAQTRELLKVYNAEGQIENRADMSSVQEQATEDKMNSKKESVEQLPAPRPFIPSNLVKKKGGRARSVTLKIASTNDHRELDIDDM